MLELTAAAEVDSIKFEGVDLFLAEPQTSIDSSSDDIKKLANKIGAKSGNRFCRGAGMAAGGGGAAMGDEATASGSSRWSAKPATSASNCASSASATAAWCGLIPRQASDWAKDLIGNTRTIAYTLRQGCDVAEDNGERLAAEGEICWGGMHSWRAMVDLLQQVDWPKTLGFQADMAHTLLYTLGYNAPEAGILPADFDWKQRGVLDAALKKLTHALRLRTIDSYVGQNDATVTGMGSHDTTGRRCLVNDPDGNLDVVRVAGYWCATPAASRPARFVICAGTAACSPTA